MKRFGIDPACCFIILYGLEFKLKMISLVGKCQGIVGVMNDNCIAAQCREERDAWVKALEYVMHGNNFLSHLVVHRRVFMYVYYAM